MPATGSRTSSSVMTGSRWSPPKRSPPAAAPVAVAEAAARAGRRRGRRTRRRRRGRCAVVALVVALVPGCPEPPWRSLPPPWAARSPRSRRRSPWLSRSGRSPRWPRSPSRVGAVLAVLAGSVGAVGTRAAVAVALGAVLAGRPVRGRPRTGRDAGRGRVPSRRAGHGRSRSAGPAPPAHRSDPRSALSRSARSRWSYWSAGRSAGLLGPVGRRVCSAGRTGRRRPLGSRRSLVGRRPVGAGPLGGPVGLAPAARPAGVAAGRRPSGLPAGRLAARRVPPRPARAARETGAVTAASGWAVPSTRWSAGTDAGRQVRRRRPAGAGPGGTCRRPGGRSRRCRPARRSRPDAPGWRRPGRPCASGRCR